MKTTILIVVILALSTACGGDSDTQEPIPPADMVIDDVNVVIDSTRDIFTADDFPARFSNILMAMAIYAGRDAGEFAGLTVVFQDGPIPCDSPSGTCAGTLTGSVIRINGEVGSCLENTKVAHELLHALIEDGCHVDSLWHTVLNDGQGFQAYADYLNAQPETTCHVIGSLQAVYRSC